MCYPDLRRQVANYAPALPWIQGRVGGRVPGHDGKQTISPGDTTDGFQRRRTQRINLRHNLRPRLSDFEALAECLQFRCALFGVIPAT